MKSKVYNAQPGLTGIGSIVFRDEELIITQSKLPPQECYRDVILPYKGALEVWCQQHQHFYTDSMILFLTAWYVVFPKSDLVYKVFTTLPKNLNFLNRNSISFVISVTKSVSMFKFFKIKAGKGR